MNNIILKRVSLLLFLISTTIGSSNAQIFHKNPDKELFGKTSVNKKAAKVKEPKSVVRSKKKQEANKRRLDRIYEKAIRRSQKRSFDIQTPEVQARMKQNKKEYKARDKEKKKKMKAGTKRAGDKYK
jgi:hypothetical protein